MIGSFLIASDIVIYELLIIIFVNINNNCSLNYGPLFGPIILPHSLSFWLNVKTPNISSIKSVHGDSISDVDLYFASTYHVDAFIVLSLVLRCVLAK